MRKETTSSIATVTYTRPFGPSPREIIHGDLSLSPRARQSTSLRGGETRENDEKQRVRASESERGHRTREKKRTRRPFSSLSFSISLWFQLARDLANVLVTREVASVSVDLHLVQRAELLRGSSIRPSVRSSCSRATWQIALPGSSSHCFPFFLPSP